MVLRPMVDGQNSMLRNRIRAGWPRITLEWVNISKITENVNNQKPGAFAPNQL